MIEPRFPTADDQKLIPITQSLYDLVRDVNREIAALRSQSVQVDVVPLSNTTGAGGAFAWKNPYPNGQGLIVGPVIIQLYASSATATIDIGTASTATTSSNNIIDTLSVSTPGIFNNADDGGASGNAAQGLAPNEYITGTYTGVTGGIRGNVYIWYCFAAPVD